MARSSAPVSVVVGNPKVPSRTSAVGVAVAAAAARAGGLNQLGENVDSPTEPTVIELAPLGSQLFDWASAAVRSATETLAASRLAVVATPVYKATYTGLLKSFLDWFDQTGLSGVTVVPVMVGASAAHALAVEVHLRPLLVEIGASVPTRGLFILEQELEHLDATLAAWSEEAAPLLIRALRD